MREFGVGVLSFFLIVLSCALQVTVMPRIDILGAHPEVSLVVVICIGMLTRPAWGALTGFFSGLLTGALAGATLTHYVITRSVLGFGLGYLGDYEPAPRAAAGIAAIATFVNQVFLFVLAPSPDIGAFVRMVFVQALLNGILTWPVYAALRGLYRPKVV